MSRTKSPQTWDVWHARFNYSCGKGYKYRPVIIVDTFGNDSLVMMVTSVGNKLILEHDYPTLKWKEAGLNNPSIARADRIAQIPAGYLGTAGYIGHLQDEDSDALVKILVDCT